MQVLLEELLLDVVLHEALKDLTGCALLASSLLLEFPKLLLFLPDQLANLRRFLVVFRRLVLDFPDLCRSDLRILALEVDLLAELLVLQLSVR